MVPQRMPSLSDGNSTDAAPCVLEEGYVVNLGQYEILGVPIAAVDYEAAVDAALTAAQTGRQITLTCAAVHGVTLGAIDGAYRQRLNSFDLIVPDGQPVRWALRWLHGARLTDRVRGADLLPLICQAAATREVPVFLYGSYPEVVTRLRDQLLQRFPDLIIAGTRPSLFRAASEQESFEIAEEIRASGAKLVLVGLGCPRQEMWIFENRKLLPMVLIGIGSAFDTNAGLLPQPPLWLQRNGLEWLWRLAREPRRLWKRYLLLNPLYLLLLAAQKSGAIRFEASPRTRLQRSGVA